MDSLPTIVIGGGFGGLAAAYELGCSGRPCILLESSPTLGGLSGTFGVEGMRLEKFYHHWFNHDRAIMDMIGELGLDENLIFGPADVGMYYANSVHRLRSPLDLLRFRPLSLSDRFRTGLLALCARHVRDWKRLEQKSASEWLIQLGGLPGFEVVWRPLLNAKFGRYADDVSAVWMWNKLKLRGSSRSRSGRDELAYFRGGFGALADALAARVRQQGGEIRTNCPVSRVLTERGAVVGVETPHGVIAADEVLVTTPLPIALRLAPDLPDRYVRPAAKIQHLASVCLVMVLDRSLSSCYWLNVNDPTFPFVAVIEHTRLDLPEHYGGKHIVYLSRYTTEDDPLYGMDSGQLLDNYRDYLKRVFPQFDPAWVIQHFCWRAPYGQPVVTRRYSEVLPSFRTPVRGLWFCTMAQVYPEDRGVNYAVSYARRVARQMLGLEPGRRSGPGDLQRPSEAGGEREYA
jgi:protoporphyrinogen oxidase